MSKAQGTDWRQALLATGAPGWSILVRLLVGLVVFFPEGLQKLAFPDILGAGRFAHIGIPYPDIMGPFVGVVETFCRPDHPWPIHPPRGPSADRDQGRRHCLDQDSDPARPGLLDFSPAQAAALWLLEHGARSAGGLLHAAGIALSVD
jgi:hypothetical protein